MQPPHKSYPTTNDRRPQGASRGRKRRSPRRRATRMSKKRRELPWTKVDKNYVFETPDGKRTLAPICRR